MRVAEVYINKELAGILREDDKKSYTFRYEDSYFSDKTKPTISLTLTKEQQEYHSPYLFPFFFNMLSEGANKKLQSRQLKIDEEDSFGLLLATAQFDTIGAITIKPIEEKMSMPEIKYCPGTLAEGYDTYSPKCLRIVFDGKKVSHILPYDQPQQNEAVNEQFMENRQRISISGVQEKLSLKPDRNILRLTNKGEQGTYILKPIPRDLKNVDQVPANEHLTMQIANQVYKINTAANAMIFFKNGTPAYVTRRFDVKEDGNKWKIEDFATLAGKTKDIAGPDFKYEYSYEEMGALIKKFVPAWKVEIEKFFSLVVFNFLFSNGDAHLKNFSLIETQEGDSILSPAYDLVNTKLHVSDTDFALNKKLFKDDFQTATWRRNGHPCAADFIEFGRRIEVNEKRIERIMAHFTGKQYMVDEFIKRSFLSDKSKRTYQLHYDTKRNNLIA